MKKFGFTLAELVITLSIIGIAAALVAPALSGIVPDKNKVKILRYHSMLGNAISDVLNDDNLYHPYTKYDANGNLSASCEGLACIANCDTELKTRLGINGASGPDSSTWTFSGSSSAGYQITVDVDPNTTGCAYSNSCDIKKADTFIFKVDKYGAITPGDALLDAYLQNPLNMNDKKTDISKAKTLLGLKTY